MMPLDIRIVLGGVIVAIIAALGWFAYDTVYDRGYNAAMAEWKESAAKSAEAARVREQELQAKLQGAQNAAIEREKKLRADADAARAVNDGLRNDLAEYRRQLPNLTREAVERYADAASVVFGECSAEYQRLADQADRIDSDRRKLEDAWPK